jgi:ribosomal protein S27AE
MAVVRRASVEKREEKNEKRCPRCGAMHPASAACGGGKKKKK